MTSAGRSAFTRVGLIGLLAAAAGTLVPSVAQAQQGTFGCRASAIKAPVLGEPNVANPSYAPCRDGHKATLSGVGVGQDKPGQLTVRASVLSATTDQDPFVAQFGDNLVGGAASASVASAYVNAFGLVKLQVYGVSSTAGRKCLPNQSTPDIGGSSAIAHITLNGRALPVSIPLKVPLVIGTLYTNYAVKTGSEVLTRAVWLDLPGDNMDVILGEARGGATGVNCTPTVPPPTTTGA